MSKLWQEVTPPSPHTWPGQQVPPTVGNEPVRVQRRRGSGLCQQERRDTIWPGRFNRNRHPGSKPFIVFSHSTGSVRSLWDHVGTLKGAQVGCRCLWTHWGQLETGNCTEDRQGKLQDYPTHIQQQAASCLCPCLVTLPGFHIALLSLLGKLPPSGQAVLSASPTL